MRVRGKGRETDTLRRSKQGWDFPLLTLWSEGGGEIRPTLLYPRIVLPTLPTARTGMHGSLLQKSCMGETQPRAKCHYFRKASEITRDIVRTAVKPPTMSVSVGYSRPCCGQSRGWWKGPNHVCLADFRHAYQAFNTDLWWQSIQNCWIQKADWWQTETWFTPSSHNRECYSKKKKKKSIRGCASLWLLRRW